MLQIDEETKNNVGPSVIRRPSNKTKEEITTHEQSNKNIRIQSKTDILAKWQ